MNLVLVSYAMNIIIIIIIKHLTLL